MVSPALGALPWTRLPREMAAVALVTGLLCAGVPGAGAQQLQATGVLPAELEPLDRAVRSILASTGAPGAAFAVSRDERLVLARGYGSADASAGTAVEPDALFRIASVSKPITAVTVLTLVAGGRLSLDDRVLEIVEVRPPAGTSLDARAREITVRDLLHHAGGWDREATGYDPMFDVARIAVALDEPAPASARDVIRLMLSRPLDFDPGTLQVYSNLGYALLGRVVEGVTGERYEDRVRHAVLDPVGATRVRMGRSLLEHRAEGEVRYHDPRQVVSVFPGLGFVAAPYGAFSIEAMDAHGGWVATAPDLLRFTAAVDGKPARADLLPTDLLREMVAPHPSADPDSTFYAMGWYVSPDEDPPVLYHMGDLPGTTALLVLAGRTHIALLLNGNAGSRKAYETILPSLLHGVGSVESWPEVDLFGPNRRRP